MPIREAEEVARELDASATPSRIGSALAPLARAWGCGYRGAALKRTRTDVVGAVRPTHALRDRSPLLAAGHLNLATEVAETGDDCCIADTTNLRLAALLATEPLTDRRLGVYLHGSLATGDFVPHRSDLDVLAVVRDGSCGEEELRALGEALRMAPPAVGVDLHVVEESAVRMPEPAVVRLLYARVEPDRRFVFAGGTGDLDLTVTCEITRRSAEALLGPPAAEPFEPIPRDWLLAAANAR